MSCPAAAWRGRGQDGVPRNGRCWGSRSSPGLARRKSPGGRKGWEETKLGSRLTQLRSSPAPPGGAGDAGVHGSRPGSVLVPPVGKPRAPLGAVTSCGSSSGSQTAGSSRGAWGCAHSSKVQRGHAGRNSVVPGFAWQGLIVLASPSVPGGTDLPRPDSLGNIPQNRAALFSLACLVTELGHV